MDNNFLTTNLYHRNAVKCWKLIQVEWRVVSMQSIWGLFLVRLQLYLGKSQIVSPSLSVRALISHSSFFTSQCRKNCSAVVTFFSHLREGWTWVKLQLWAIHLEELPQCWHWQKTSDLGEELKDQVLGYIHSKGSTGEGGVVVTAFASHQCGLG